MGLLILVPLSWLIPQEVGLSSLDGFAHSSTADQILDEVGLSNLDGFSHPGAAELVDSGRVRLK